MNEHISKHGDGVKDIAFTVDDVKKIYEAAVENGAKSVLEPTITKDDKDGTIILAAVQTYGETIHTFVERKNYKGVFLPGFKDVSDKKRFLNNNNKITKIN